MALTITNSSYSGKHAGEYLASALLTNDTVANGGVTVKPNILHKEVLNVVSTSGNLISNATCDYTTSGNVAMVEKILQVEDFQINQTICKSTFVNDWLAAEAGFSAHRELPDTFEKFIVEHFAGKISDNIERTLWSGVNANVGEFDGIETLLAADSDVIDVTGAALTSSNILAQLAAVAEAIPSAILYSPDMKIYLSSRDMQKFTRALGGFSSVGAAGIDNQGPLWYNGQDLKFDGISVFHAPGLSEGKIVAGQTSSFYYGTSLLSDSQDLRIIDTSATLGDDNVRFVARFSAGAQIGIGSEIVYRTVA
jgi:hypothetical protein